MKIEWPLWWHLEPEAQALLMEYQWDNWGLRLDTPPLVGETYVVTFLKSPEEIDRLMRQPPRHQKRAV